MDKRGQSSIEYMAAISFVLLAIAAVGMYIYSDIETGNRMATASSTMQDIKKTADRVYASGPGRKETITIRVPTGVKKTQVQNGLIGMAVAIPNAGDTDNIEVVDADRVIGKIPSRDGIYQLPIEYKPSGVLVIGTGLLVEPPIVIYTTSPNSTTFIINVTNIADKNITGIDMTAGGPNPGWFAFNETGFDLDVLEVKTINVSVTIPAGEIPSIYTSYMQANTSEYFDENTVEIHIGGDICGDMILAPLDQCEATSEFAIPDEDNAACNNPLNKCYTNNRTYVEYGDTKGACDANGPNCVCKPDTPTVTYCTNDACTGGEYCYICDHCHDGVKNCLETTTDSGGTCAGGGGGSGGCPGGVCVPVEDMEPPVDYEIGGNCLNEGFENTTNSTQGINSGNMTFERNKNCIASWCFNIEDRGDGFYSNYASGIFSFDIYINSGDGISPSHALGIKIGNNDTNCVCRLFGKAELASAIGAWETVNTGMDTFNLGDCGTAGFTCTKPVNWAGTIQTACFNTRVSNSGSPSGPNNMMIDDVKIWCLEFGGCS